MLRTRSEWVRLFQMYSLWCLLFHNVVIKRHLCNLIYVGHFIVLLSRHDVIAEMIFTHLEKNHYHSVSPANANEKWLFLSRKSMVSDFFLTADINECEKIDTCGGEANCENTFGSYKCNCSSKGFEYNAKRRGCFDKKCLVGPLCK